MYQFYLRKAHVFFLTNDVAGSLNTLNQGAALAEKRGDFDLKVNTTRLFVVLSNVW